MTSFLQRANSGALGGNHPGLRKSLWLWSPGSGCGRYVVCYQERKQAELLIYDLELINL